MKNALLFSVIAAILAGYAMFTTRELTFTPSYASYTDTFNLYLMDTLAKPQAFRSDPAAAEFRTYSGDKLGREYLYFTFYRVLLNFTTVNAAMKILSFSLALITAFFFYRTSALILPGRNGALYGGLMLFTVFLAMNSFYYGQNRTFGAAICAAWFYLALSGRGWASPAFMALFLPFYPYLAAAAVIHSCVYPFAERENFSLNRKAWAALMAASIAVIILMHYGPDIARDNLRVFGYKSLNRLGEPISRLNPLHFVFYFVLNLDEHGNVYTALLTLSLLTGGALRLTRSAATSDIFSARLRNLAFAHGAAFLALYPFNPFASSRQLIFFLPFAATLWLARLATEHWKNHGLKTLCCASAGLFMALHLTDGDIRDYSGYERIYSRLRAGAPALLAAGPAASKALASLPLYSGTPVFYSTQLTEAWLGRAPGFDFSGRESEQEKALCAPDLSATERFARKTGVTHFLVEPGLLRASCRGPEPALLKLALDGRPAAGSGDSGPAFLLEAAELRKSAGENRK